MNEIDSNSMIEIPHIGKCSIEQLKILLVHLKTRYDSIKRYRDIVHEFRTEKFYNPSSPPDEIIYNIYDAVERESNCEQSNTKDLMLKDIKIFFDSIQR